MEKEEDHIEEVLEGEEVIKQTLGVEEEGMEGIEVVALEAEVAVEAEVEPDLEIPGQLIGYVRIPVVVIPTLVGGMNVTSAKHQSQIIHKLLLQEVLEEVAEGVAEEVDEVVEIGVEEEIDEEVGDMVVDLEAGRMGVEEP